VRYALVRLNAAGIASAVPARAGGSGAREHLHQLGHVAVGDRLVKRNPYPGGPKSAEIDPPGRSRRDELVGFIRFDRDGVEERLV